MYLKKEIKLTLFNIMFLLIIFTLNAHELPQDVLCLMHGQKPQMEFCPGALVFVLDICALWHTVSDYVGMCFLPVCPSVSVSSSAVVSCGSQSFSPRFSVSHEAKPVPVAKVRRMESKIVIFGREPTHPPKA